MRGVSGERKDTAAMALRARVRMHWLRCAGQSVPCVQISYHRDYTGIRVTTVPNVPQLLWLGNT